MGVPLYVICHFSLADLNIFSLSLISFWQLDYCMPQCVPPWIYSTWDFLCFLDLVDYFLSHIKEIFSYYLFKYFLRSYFSLFFWDPYNVNLGLFNVVPESLRLPSFLFILLSIFCSAAVISTILSSRLFICSSAWVWVNSRSGITNWWTWVWVNSGSRWWPGRPGMLRFMGSQRVGYDWASELNWWVKNHLILCWAAS